MGTLYVVATPIGNLGDVTARALEVLERVDLIAAEDTRVTGRLLAAKSLRRPMLSYRAPVERRALPRLLDALARETWRWSATPARPPSAILVSSWWRPPGRPVLRWWRCRVRPPSRP